MIARRIISLAVLMFLLACRSATTYDVVVENGRVMDPESGFDSVTNIEICAGCFEAISAGKLNGTRAIDATGPVVARGFIDLHQHGQQEESHALLVRDGVTTALELEAELRRKGA